MKLNQDFFAVFSVFLLLHSIPATTAQEVEDEMEFDYIEGSSKGPVHWSDIHEEWAACGKGDYQSPIDLLHERVDILPNLGRLNRSYKLANSTLKNRGHDIMLEWKEGAGSIHVSGTEYHLKQCHWHSPSEHSIDGLRHDMEVHMVHESTDHKIAVVGIMYKIGRLDNFLSELMAHVRSIAYSKKAETEVGVVDPRHIKIGSRKYYRYTGSLTTPPCTEGVVWTIVRKVRTVSREQVRLLREAVHDNAEENARPLQPSNRRPVYEYSPRSGTQSHRS